MTELVGDGIYLIVTQPQRPFADMPAIPAAVSPQSSRVAYHEAQEGETTVDAIVRRVVGPDELCCGLLAFDSAHALEFAMDPNVLPVARQP